MSLFSMEPERYWQIPPTANYQAKKDIIIKHAIEDGDYIASEKIDGNWCRFVTEDGIGKMQTRGISKVTGTYGEVHEKVPAIFNELLNKFPCIDGPTMLIGELFVPGGDDKTIGSILRCLPAKAIQRQTVTKVKFRIFDVWHLIGFSFMTTPYFVRVQELEKLRRIFADSENIEISNFLVGPGIYDFLENIFNKGGEGIVLQYKNGLPEPGKRPAQKTIKIKKEIEKPIDVVLIGTNPPTREYTGKELEGWNYWENVKTEQRVNENKYQAWLDGEMWEPITKNYYNQWIGSIIVGLYYKDSIMPLCSVSSLTEELKADITNNFNDYYLKPLVITGMEFSYTDKGVSVRHPKFKYFRDDIPAKDCTFEKVFGEVDIINI